MSVPVPNTARATYLTRAYACACMPNDCCLLLFLAAVISYRDTETPSKGLSRVDSASGGTTSSCCCRLLTGSCTQIIHRSACARCSSFKHLYACVFVNAGARTCACTCDIPIRVCNTASDPVPLCTAHEFTLHLVPAIACHQTPISLPAPLPAPHPTPMPATLSVPAPDHGPCPGARHDACACLGTQHTSSLLERNTALVNSTSHSIHHFI